MIQQDQDPAIGSAAPVEKAAAQQPVCFELDPGMKYIVKAMGVSGPATLLGEIYSIQEPGGITEYFVVNAALPAGSTSIKISAVSASSAPSSFTFQTSSVQFGSITPPAASSTLFVDSTKHIGLVWNFTQNQGIWSGSATWYNNSGSLISIGAGSAVTLTNNKLDNQLVYRATNSSPSQ
ncbi:uncharacterized protein SOCE26_007840 [Sorangium cellulosum]|uniref:Uncharacterized protein n=1 Tax=Sorangium cellulosum TaxID=56 RepID=A0A2L0EJB4_SORCE|nr:hypothetical protein [Sorangium cellulosum]AUX39393.1 uncharacterized protein SOCE26_007840 [Sorangium cellulosum]